MYKKQKTEKENSMLNIFFAFVSQKEGIRQLNNNKTRSTCFEHCLQLGVIFKVSALPPPTLSLTK